MPGKGNKKRAAQARQNTLQVLMRVAEGVSLSALQARWINALADNRDRALCQELVYGVLRWRWKLDALLGLLLQKKLKVKDRDVQNILRLALYELMSCRTPPYAVINDAVLLVRGQRKHWACGLVNAVLRNFLRQSDALIAQLSTEPACYSHPLWMQEKIKHDWPSHWQQILQANNQRPPLWLRVNALQHSTADYQRMLQQSGYDVSRHRVAGQALKLNTVTDVTSLPDFAQGAVSVQDAGAQLSAALLDVQPGQRVLDLCAAPGGKSCHLLETCPSLEQLVAVEIDSSRMQRVEENLQRLQLKADCVIADARDIGQRYDRDFFERILIDAPCSASGVIRRHPDIKSLRRETDIAALCRLQAEILATAWPVLKPGGQLLYVTCSIFKQENEQQIDAFLRHTSDAENCELSVEWGQPCSVGRQLLPGEDDADGFYFCLLRKL